MLWEHDNRLNDTQNAIMEYLSKELSAGGKFVSYTKIGKEVHRSKQSIRYSMRKLQIMGYVYFYDNKMYLA